MDIVLTGVMLDGKEDRMTPKFNPHVWVHLAFFLFSRPPRLPQPCALHSCEIPDEDSLLAGAGGQRPGPRFLWFVLCFGVTLLLPVEPVSMREKWIRRESFRAD